MMGLDLDDELLALAAPRDNDGRPRKKKRASDGGAPKKRKEKLESDSDMDLESEEDDSNPVQYPLEGKYIDESDRAKLLDLPEIEREEILAQRQEEMQRWRDRQALDKLVKSQSGQAVDDDDSASKRKPGAREKLDKYKAERKAKEERRQAMRDRPGSPSSSRKAHAQSDSSSDDEEGQYSRVEEENDRFDKQFGRDKEPPVGIADLRKIQVTRSMIGKYIERPWFEKLIAGAWVRIMVGSEKGENVYRICEALKIGEIIKPYSVEGNQVIESVELKHGQAIREFTMERVSNVPFTDKEFDRLTRTCALEKVKLPSRRDIERKQAEIKRLTSQPRTNADIDYQLKRKAQIDRLLPSRPWDPAKEYAHLLKRHDLAFQRKDREETKNLQAALREFEEKHPNLKERYKRERESDDNEDLMARINKRNKLANEENVRRAEAAEAERKRRERRLGMNRADSADPSARLKTIPKTFTPRSGTPSTPNGKVGTPSSTTPLPNLSPLPVAPPTRTASTFDAVVQSIEVDLGDF
ncbi:plus-3-domain-containing protein [Auricularia subglabra TFB-10046 SS5]|nr:plus-3-domain-containing protein [Auricularia subglabra TFB-10046 SS5]